MHSVTSAQNTASPSHCAAILGRARFEERTTGLWCVKSLLPLSLARSQVLKCKHYNTHCDFFFFFFNDLIAKFNKICCTSSEFGQCSD